MSKLEALREAIVKVDEAETALFLVKQNYRKSNDKDYDTVDQQFEVLGDASKILMSLLSKLENEKLSEMQE